MKNKNAKAQKVKPFDGLNRVNEIADDAGFYAAIKALPLDIFYQLPKGSQERFQALDKPPIADLTE